VSARATLTPQRPLRTAAGAPDRLRRTAAAATDGGGRDASEPPRDHLLERLHNLRSILPVFAAELASARRQAAQLRAENRRLSEQLRRLQDDALARASATARRRLGSHAAHGARAGRTNGR
jgi:hypothetical protein